MLIEQKCVLSMYASLSKYPGVCQNQYNKTQNICFYKLTQNGISYVSGKIRLNDLCYVKVLIFLVMMVKKNLPDASGLVFYRYVKIIKKLLFFRFLDSCSLGYPNETLSND